MKRILALLLMISAFSCIWADDIPFREQRRELFRVMPIHEESIVFLGNSITNFNVWSDAFGGDTRIVNRGVAGITSAEVLEHIDLIACGKPKKLFLMIGINDFATPEATVPNVKGIIDIMKKESPKTEIYIQSVLPTNRGERSPYVEPWNKDLEKLCQETGVTYIDVWSRLIKSATDHGLKAECTTDNLHMNGPGYREWTRGFEQYTGIAPVYAEGTAQYINGFNAVENMQLSNYCLLPVEEGDVLMLGDWNVYMGEWTELLRNPKVKNRGIGTGLGYSLTISHLLSMVPHIVKPAAGKVFISCGAKDLYSNVQPSTAAQSYSQVLDAIRQAAPEAEIYVQSILPDADATVNTAKIQPFNEAIRQLAEADKSGKVKFIDIYSELAEDGALARKFVSANTQQSKGVNGRAYLRWANVIAPYISSSIQPLPELSDAEFQLREQLSATRRLYFGAKAGEELGQYPAQVLEGLLPAIQSAEKLLANAARTETEMANEAEKLAAICAKAEAARVKMPRVSTGNTEYWYSLSTPLREGRYVQSTGTGKGLVGAAAGNAKNLQWKFTERQDGTLDIVNRSDGSYIDPSSAAENNQLLTSASSPGKGWTLSPAENEKYFIICSGTVQLNQTTSALGRKIYNWGSGTNKGDAGCQFMITPVTAEPDPDPTLPESLLTLTGIGIDGSGPYRIPDELSRPVIEAETVTVAIDFTLESATSEQTLVGCSNPLMAEDFVSIFVNNGNNFGIRYNNTTGKYSQSASISTNRHQIVAALQPSNPSYTYWFDGSFMRNVAASAPVISTVSGEAGLYLGGLVCSDNPNKYPMRGTIHSIQFFPGNFTDQQVGLISYSDLIPTAISTPPSTADAPFFTIDHGKVVLQRQGEASLYDTSGRRLPMDTRLPAGAYILKSGKASHKILVR